jgi:hypothetical protein
VNVGLHNLPEAGTTIGRGDEYEEKERVMRTYEKLLMKRMSLRIPT